MISLLAHDFRLQECDSCRNFNYFSKKISLCDELHVNIFQFALSLNQQARELPLNNCISEENNMTTFKKTAIATLAIATFAASTFAADARSRHYGRGIGLGIVGGIVAGAVIAGAGSRAYEDDYYDDRPVYRPRYRSSHVTWCYNRYRSYDARSNTYVSYGGRVRNCNSPYGR